MPDQDFEREKWTVERDFKERELKLKEVEAKCSRWLNPLVIAILAAAIAGAGNALAMWMNWGAQVDLEKIKAEAAKVLEDSKAKATRILEMIKTGDDPDKAATNLKFPLPLRALGLRRQQADAGPPGGGFSENKNCF